MLEFKQNVAAQLPVRLISSSTGGPAVGIASATVTATAKKSDGTIVSLTVTGNWLEENNGAFSQTGTYFLSIPSGVLSLAGILSYAVAVSGCDPYIGVVKVIANETADVYGRLGTPAGATIAADIASNTTAISANTTGISNLSSKVGTPAGASIAADIATIGTSTSGLSSALQDVLDYHQGKWEIKVTGADANKLILYRADGTTVLKKFALADPQGNPTFINPFSRTPTT
jgi:hypothetical protein